MRLPIKHVIGYALLAISAGLWLAIFVVPFLDLSGGRIAIVITVLVVVAEVAFLLAVLLLGKTIIQKMKDGLQKAKAELARKD